MKPYSQIHTCLIGFIVLFYGCFTVATVMGQGPAASKENFGVTMEMTEHAHDGPYTVPVDRIVKVDANSDLLLTFNTDEITSVGASDGVNSNREWKRVNELLSTIKSLEKERNQINESRLTIDITKSKQMTDYREQVRTFNLKVDSLLKVNGLRSYGFEDLSKQELDRILLGTFDGGPAQPKKLYQNLARWLNEEIKSLRSETAVFQKSLNRKVEVQALHEPRVGEAKYLHIDGYDNLPAGDFQPIDRKGLNMTPAEQKRLSAEIKLAKAAAKSIREIQGQGAEAKTTIRDVLKEFKTKLDPLKQALKEQPKDWSATIDSLLSTLKKTQASAQPGALKDAATQGIVVVKSTQNIVKGLQKTQELQDIIEIFKSGDLELVLVGPTNLFGKIKEYRTRLTTIKNSAKNLPGEVKKLKTVLGNLPSGIQGNLKIIVSKQATTVLNKLATTIPATMLQTKTAVNLVFEVLGRSLPGIQASDTLKEPQTIPRSIDNLVPARVELTKAGLTLGDRISVKVRMYNLTDGENPKKTSEKQVTYKVEAALMGLHRRIGADLIFARGFGSSMARDWKPNVAARAEWHYLIREPKEVGQKTWNFIDPGVGLHLANLDQGSDSVEIGIGVNISFWEGLLSGGYGHNLGTDRQYVFIGLNLLNVLSQARDNLNFN